VIIVGIDPGKDGGYAEMTDGRLTYVGLLNENIDRLRRLEFEDAHIWMEKAQVMNREGRPTSATAMFSYGRGFGRIEGLIEAMHIPCTLVIPAEWSREMHRGTAANQDTKARSYEAAKRLFPDQTFLATESSYKPHDGMFEAALIAEYGRRRLAGQ